MTKEQAIEQLKDLKAVYSGAVQAGEISIANMIKGGIDLIEKLQKENEELKADNYELNNRITDLLENIPVQKVKDILNEINKEYIKQEEIFDKHFEKENRDMQDYYIQKEATNIMQELSWIEGKLQELIDRRTKDDEK